MPTSSADWHRLARYLADRVAFLDLTQTDVYAAGGPSPTLWRDLLQGDRDNYQAGTLRKIDRAMQWTSGSASAVLRGGEPTSLERSTVRPSAEGADVAHLRDPLRDGLDEQAERELERQAALLRLDVERRRQRGAK